jgi:hypothetical protein
VFGTQERIRRIKSKRYTTEDKIRVLREADRGEKNISVAGSSPTGMTGLPLQPEKLSRQFCHFFTALIFAQCAFCAAAILRLTAALLLRFAFGATANTRPVEELKIRPSSFWSD